MCCGNNISIAGITRQAPVVDQGNPCSRVTIDTLELYKERIECIVKSGRYGEVPTSVEETTNAVNILSQWIEVKVHDPLSCEYMQYLSVMQDLVKRIILSAVCN